MGVYHRKAVEILLQNSNLNVMIDINIQNYSINDKTRSSVNINSDSEIDLYWPPCEGIQYGRQFKYPSSLKLFFFLNLNNIKKIECALDFDCPIQKNVFYSSLDDFYQEVNNTRGHYVVIERYSDFFI